MKSSKIWKDRF